MLGRRARRSAMASPETAGTPKTPDILRTPETPETPEAPEAPGTPGTDSAAVPHVEFRVDPSAYRHWRLAVDGVVATLTMDVDEAGGLVPGYELKLNSYDLGVDIELYAAVQR